MKLGPYGPAETIVLEALQVKVRALDKDAVGSLQSCALGDLQGRS